MAREALCLKGAMAGEAGVRYACSYKASARCNQDSLRVNLTKHQQRCALFQRGESGGAAFKVGFCHSARY
jgi:hypothetical protein